jgi:hypothetical protein
MPPVLLTIEEHACTRPIAQIASGNRISTQTECQEKIKNCQFRFFLSRKRNQHSIDVRLSSNVVASIGIRGFQFPDCPVFNQMRIL